MPQLHPVSGWLIQLHHLSIHSPSGELNKHNRWKMIYLISHSRVISTAIWNKIVFGLDSKVKENKSWSESISIKGQDWLLIFQTNQPSGQCFTPSSIFACMKKGKKSLTAVVKCKMVSNLISHLLFFLPSHTLLSPCFWFSLSSGQWFKALHYCMSVQQFMSQQKPSNSTFNYPGNVIWNPAECLIHPNFSQ